MIIFGWKSRITPHSDNDILEKCCPECGSDLELSNLKSWFTLYFIPVFPYRHIDTLYFCKKCESSFKQDARNKLLGSHENHAQLKEEMHKMFLSALVACMTQMAKIDGSISPEERSEINQIIESNPELKDELKKVMQKIEKSKDKDEVFEMLRKTSAILTAEGIMALIARIARVLLADGKIDKAEEALMREYLLVCGVPTKIYDEIIKNIK